MKYTVRVSYVLVLGYIWMPDVLASMRYTIDARDLEQLRDDDGAITRESIAEYLTSHTGDFRSVEDFYASIEDGNQTLDFPWSSEDNECAYLDTLGDDL